MKKLITVCTVLALCLGMAACGKKEKKEDKKDNDPTTTESIFDIGGDVTNKAPEGVNEYYVNGFSSIGDKSYINIIIGDDYENYYQLEVSDPEFADVLYSFNSNYILKTDASSGKLGEYELIDSTTGENLGQLGKDEIREKYDPTAKYETVEFSLDKEVKLSELEEGKMYKAESVDEMPEFINDTDKDYLVWVMDDFQYHEEGFAYPAKSIEGLGREEPYMSSFGDYTYVRIETLTPDKLDPENYDLPEAAYVNGLKAGDNVEFGTASIMVNAGTEDVNAEIGLSDGKSLEMTFKAGDIYAMNWINLDHITIK